LLQKEPDLTHQEIATRINKSIPAIGARMLKLERKNLLVTQFGINFAKHNFTIAVATMYALNPKELARDLATCPFVLNVFSTMGSRNVTAWLISTSLAKIEEIVELHLRARADIKYLEMHIVTETFKDTILPVNFAMEHHDHMSCGKACHDLARESIDHPVPYTPSTTNHDIDNILHIDVEDKKIISYLQRDPDMTFTEIGAEIGKSQPMVGSRVNKLRSRQIIGLQKGVNYKDVKLPMVQAYISTFNATSVMRKLGTCPFVVTGFKAIGERSLIAYIAGSSWKEIDDVLDTCFRSDPDIIDIETMIVIRYENNLVLPFPFDQEYIPGTGCVNCPAFSAKMTKNALEMLPVMLRKKPLQTSGA
jgi:DNA-binding Lrp family transcriptional regulator